jgi:hypothetical protein
MFAPFFFNSFQYLYPALYQQHKLKPKLATFNPRKSRKFVKIAGNRVLAALLASGGYDDNLPAQARNTRQPEDLRLIEPLTVDTWAEVCAEFRVDYLFTTALVKWVCFRFFSLAIMALTDIL